MEMRRENNEQLTLEFCELYPGDKFSYENEICVAMDNKDGLRAAGILTGRVYQMEWAEKVRLMELFVKEPEKESLRPLFEDRPEPGMIVYNDALIGSECPENDLYVITDVTYLDDGTASCCACVNLHTGDLVSYDRSDDSLSIWTDAQSKIKTRERN